MDPLRKELSSYLRRGSAHAPLAEAAKDLPPELMNGKIDGIPFTPWMLLEHIRVTQGDMVDFIRNPNYQGMKWPDAYWPPADKKAGAAAWSKTMKEYEKDLRALEAIVLDEKNDLFAPIPHGSGQTIMKEVLQVIDHTSYHAGELILMRRAMHAWKQ
ncbi:MAG TPA: DinB family protein [Candidatus Paceibacterota bacterium]|jgi:hypothetical protein|nr:DinB family protein [Candidatus Paceibacterota bacterium]